MNEVKPKTSEQAVIFTSILFDIFEMSLKKDDLLKKTFFMKVSKEELEKVLQDSFTEEDEYFFLKGGKKRVSNEKYLEEKIDLIKKNLDWIKEVPFLRSALISGSLARGHSQKKSDIDLFLIFRRNRLFTGRFFLMSKLKLKKIFNRKNVKGFCLNHFCTDNLDSISEKNLYTASLVTHFLPIVDDGFFEKFLKKNSWSKDFFPNGNLQEPFSHCFSFIQGRRNKKEKFLKGELGNWFEKFFEIIQRIKIALNLSTYKKQAKIVVNKKEIALHPEPKAEKFILEFERRVAAFLNPYAFQKRILGLEKRAISDQIKRTRSFVRSNLKNKIIIPDAGAGEQKKQGLRLE